MLRESYCCFSTSTMGGNKSVLWEITNRCNLRCPYCHVNFDTLLDMCFSFERISEILMELKAQHFSKIIISGGEPLLYASLERLLESIRSHGFELDLCSNGTLITPKVANMLSRQIDRVTITLDCFDEVILDKMKGVKGTLGKTVNGIKNLLNAGIIVNVTLVLTSLNYANIPQTINKLEKIGIKSISLLSLYSFGQTKSFDIVSSEVPSLTDVLSKIFHSSKNSTTMLTAKGVYTEGNSLGQCQGGENIFGIDANGYLLPCILLRLEDEALDLNKNSVETALRSPTMQRMIKEKNELRCTTCPKDSTCGKGCIATGFIKDRKVSADLRCLQIGEIHHEK